MAKHVDLSKLKNEVTVKLSLEEVVLLTAALGNHSRSEMREHIENDFTSSAATSIIPVDASTGMFQILAGQEPTHNLFGKLVDTFEELNG